MADDSVLWFNPSCSKCRQAVQLLRDRGVHPQLREYLREKPSRAEIEALLAKLPNAAEAVRNGEDEYGASGLTQFSSPQQIAAAIEKAPVLLQRPILEHKGRAVIGRPPERVLELL